MKSANEVLDESQCGESVHRTYKSVQLTAAYVWVENVNVFNHPARRITQVDRQACLTKNYSDEKVWRQMRIELTPKQNLLCYVQKHKTR